MSTRRTLAIGAALAAVIALSAAGGAVGGSLIGTDDIKDGAVTSPKIHDGAVRTAKLHNGAVTKPKLADALKAKVNAVPELQNDVDDLDGRVSNLEQSLSTCAPATDADFGINSEGQWTVLGAPFTRRQGTIVIDHNVVHLATYPPGEYADAGVIVPLGTVADNFREDGSLIVPEVAGPYADQVAINLYIDSGADGDYLTFDENGDFTGTPAGGGVYNPSGDQVLFNVDGTTTEDDITAPHGNVTSMWAWVGVSGGHDQTAALTKVAGHDLAVC